MSVLISERSKFIFIHVHKTGGTSVSHALLPFCNRPHESIKTLIKRKLGALPDYRKFDPHITAVDLKSALSSETWDGFYKIGFVRNPWDWHVSLYNHIMRDPEHPTRETVEKLESFEEYIKWRCDEGRYFQSDFLCDGDGKVLVDFVGKFEKLEADFEAITRMLRVSAQLPSLNRGGANVYRSHYDTETFELVRQAYEKDIKKFGYEDSRLDSGRNIRSEGR